MHYLRVEHLKCTIDAADNKKLKDALLRNFDITERGFRKKSVMTGLKGQRHLFSSVVDCAVI